MISNPFFLLSILISSLFAFFTIAFVVEIFINILQIKKHRIRSTLRLIPFIALMMDLLFSQYSIVSWLNPLSCASCLQKLFLEIFPSLKNYLIQNEICLMTYLGDIYQGNIFSIIFVSVIALSFLFVIAKTIQAFMLTYSLYSIRKRSTPYELPFDNMQLNFNLKKNKVKIYISNEISIPLTVYPNIIIIPQETIKILAFEEIEAVIAHEWEHIKYKDSLIRLVYHLIAKFFWWVPTQSWIKKIEEEQELACDQNVLNYGIGADSIASALYKVAKQIKGHQTLCYFANQKNSTLMRIQKLLSIHKIEKQPPILGFKFVGICFGLILLLLCSLYL